MAKQHSGVEIPDVLPKIVRNYLRSVTLRGYVYRNRRGSLCPPDITLGIPRFPWEVALEWYSAVVCALYFGPTRKVNHLPVDAIGSSKRFVAHGAFPVSFDRTGTLERADYLVLSVDKLCEFSVSTANNPFHERKQHGPTH
jgi:hypothetical protein